jgi:hypothetical protein
VIYIQSIERDSGEEWYVGGLERLSFGKGRKAGPRRGAKGGVGGLEGERERDGGGARMTHKARCETARPYAGTPMGQRGARSLLQARVLSLCCRRAGKCRSQVLDG